MKRASGADMLGDVGQEGDDVVLGLALDRVDPVDLERALRPDRGGGFLRHDAQLGERVGGMRLDLEPDAEARLGRPDRGHLGAGIAGDHGRAFVVEVGRHGVGARVAGAGGGANRGASDQPLRPQADMAVQAR